MTAQKGSLFLLKVGDGNIPENFTTIGGLRLTKMLLRNQTLESTDIESGAWREIMPGGGIRGISISGSGIFTNSTTEETFRTYAFNNYIKNYQLNFGNGHKLSGPFQVVSYERSAVYDDEEIYSIILESAGVIIFST